MMKPGRILIQFPEDVKEILKQRAEENVRSINGEVVHLIRFALKQIAEQKQK
jgi:hypothetical protein